MKLHTYLNFPGTTREAFQYYEQHLGAKIEALMKYAEMPGDHLTPPEWSDPILHGQLQIGGTTLMASDVPNAEPTRSSYLTILAPDSAEAERMFGALAEGGKILMPMEETFFAHRFGEVRDRYGIAWMVLHQRNCPE